MILTKKFRFDLAALILLLGLSQEFRLLFFYSGVTMKLLDEVKQRYSIKNDAQLSRTLDVPPPTISKIRSGKINVSADIILRIHECLGMPVADIRSLL